MRQSILVFILIFTCLIKPHSIAAAQNPVCQISGIVRDAQRQPAANVRIRITPVSITGGVIYNSSITITTNSSGVLQNSNGNDYFELIQGGTYRIEGPILGDYSKPGGKNIQVPGTATADFDNLISVVSVPSTGLTVKDEGVSLPTLIGSLNFVGSGVSVTQPSAGSAMVTISGGGGSGLTSLAGQTGAMQTFSRTNDTNVTLALNSAGDNHSFTLGWTGQLSVARGGTGAASFTGILKGNGTSAFTAVAAPTGALVGDTDTQTLQNKTLASPIFSGVPIFPLTTDVLGGLAAPLTAKWGSGGTTGLSAIDLTGGDFTTLILYGGYPAYYFNYTSGGSTNLHLDSNSGKASSINLVNTDSNGGFRIINDPNTSGRAYFTNKTENGLDVIGLGGQTPSYPGIARSNTTVQFKLADASAFTNGEMSGLLLRDTDASHSLNIIAGSNLTANRNFTIITGDAARQLTMTGDASISGTNTGDQTLSDTTISTTDITTNNASTLKHGFLPKLSGNPSNCLLGDGTWGACSVGGGGGIAASDNVTWTGTHAFTNKVTFSGAVVKTPVTVTGSSTIAATTTRTNVNGSAPNTQTLPALSAVDDGWETTIQDVAGNAATNNITVQRTGSDVFESGVTSVVITCNFCAVGLRKSNGVWIRF